MFYGFIEGKCLNRRNFWSLKEDNEPCREKFHRHVHVDYKYLYAYTLLTTCISLYAYSLLTTCISLYAAHTVGYMYLYAVHTVDCLHAPVPILLINEFCAVVTDVAIHVDLSCQSCLAADELCACSS